MQLQINHQELEDDLIVSFMTNKPLMVYGGTGIGKSQTIMKAAKSYAQSKSLEFIEYAKVFNSERDKMASDPSYSITNKFIFFDIRSAMLDPSDIKGLPSITGPYVRWLPDIIFRIASRPDFSGLIFFDEINQALPAVQSALYQVILDNSAGTIKLSDKCLRAAAGNRAKDRSNVNVMSKALMQRFMNCELAAPSAKEWVENFARPNNIYPSIISYIQYKKDHLNVELNDVKEQRSFANPRGWARMSDQMYAIDKLHLTKDNNYFAQLDRLADSNIGGEAGVTFSAYMKLHNMIDIKEILKNPESINSLSIDKKWFAMDMLADEYSKEGKNIIEQIVSIFQNIDADLVINTIKNIRNQKGCELFMHQFENSKNGARWYIDNAKLFI